jgi:predicted permease
MKTLRLTAQDDNHRAEAMFHKIRSRLKALVPRGALDREMRDEMALHIEQATQRLMGRGLSESDAREAARREFGNMGALEEEAWDARGSRWIESLAADVRYALRHFSRTPITAITLVLVLALGIGVNSLIFSVLQSYILRAPPGVSVDASLVRVRGTQVMREKGLRVAREFSGPELAALAAHHDVFASVTSWASASLMFSVGDSAGPRALRSHFVSPNYFSTLGVRPMLGPGLPSVKSGDVAGSELAVVLAYPIWEQFGADSSIFGRAVRVNGIEVRVVGVAPRNFQGPFGGPDAGVSLWMPLDARAQVVRGSPFALADRDSTFLEAVARLTPNTTREQATSVARVVATQAAPERREAIRGDRVEYSTEIVKLSGAGELDIASLLGFTLAVIGALLILLITCTNVSALLVGAGVARQREIAIRLSLGASRHRIVRQLITESTLIASAGGGLGLATYGAIFKWLSWEYGAMPIYPDLVTVGFTALIALGTGIVFGMSPALHATRIDVSSSLKNAGGSGSTSRSRLQRAFIVAQICLTQPLLIGLVMVFGIARTEFGGFRIDDPLADQLIQIHFNAGDDSHARVLNAKQQRIREVMNRVAQLPGVEGVSPQAADFAVADFRVPVSDRGDGPRAGEMVQARLDYAPPGYLALRAIPLIRGRDLIASDTLGVEWPIVIGNDLARSFFGTSDPIGRRMEVPASGAGPGLRAVVVGVFDTTHAAARGAVRIYTAHAQFWWKNLYLIRTRGPGSSIIPSVRQIVHASLPDIQVYGLRTLGQIGREDRRDIVMVSSMAAGGGALALLLASIGLYGVVALGVRQRNREIGIRVALGARPRQVIAMFFASGLRVSVLGLLLGLPLTVAAMYLIVSRVAVRYLDTSWLVGGGAVIAVLVIAVASLATWIPARRAAGVDPLTAIRVE